MADETTTFYEHCLRIKDEFTRKMVFIEWAFKDMPELAKALSGGASMEEMKTKLIAEYREKHG